MKKAFTLIEMLFTLTILSIVIGYAISNIKNQDSAKDIIRLKADMKNLKNKIDFIYLKNNKILPNTEGLLIDTNNDGYAENLILNEKIEVNNNNQLSYENNSVLGPKCFIIKGLNPGLSNKYILDSCNDSEIHKQ